MKEFDNPYILSRDYSRLFDLLYKDKEIVAYTDYSFDDDDPRPCRDVCKVRRFEEFHIQFSVRGTVYGGVEPWDECFGDELDEICEQRIDAILKNNYEFN